MNLPQIVSFN